MTKCPNTGEPSGPWRVVHFSAFSAPPNALIRQVKAPKTGNSGKSVFSGSTPYKGIPSPRPAFQRSSGTGRYTGIQTHLGRGRGGRAADRSTMSNIKAPQETAARKPDVRIVSYNARRRG